MLPVLTITLNPALDLTTSTDRLAPTRKLRCTQPRFDPGGGGVNVSRAIKELGGESRAFVAVGGSTGTRLRTMLESAGLDCEFWMVGEETRTSLTIMEKHTGQHYRFVMPGPTLNVSEAEGLLPWLQRLIGPAPGLVVLSGSLPPGLPIDTYGRITRLARELGAKVIIDTHGEPLRAAVRERPYLIRLNHLEAHELVGGDANVAAHRLGHDLVLRGLAEIAIVTLAEEGAIVATVAGQYEIRPPKVAVRSTVGAGDSFVAALTCGLANDWPLEEAARYGVAAAAAAVTTDATELCKRDTVNAYYRQIGGLRPAA